MYDVGIQCMLCSGQKVQEIGNRRRGNDTAAASKAILVIVRLQKKYYTYLVLFTYIPDYYILQIYLFIRFIESVFDQQQRDVAR